MKWKNGCGGNGHDEVYNPAACSARSREMRTNASRNAARMTMSRVRLAASDVAEVEVGKWWKN